MDDDEQTSNVEGQQQQDIDDQQQIIERQDIPDIIIPEAQEPVVEEFSDGGKKQGIDEGGIVASASDEQQEENDESAEERGRVDHENIDDKDDSRVFESEQEVGGNSGENDGNTVVIEDGDVRSSETDPNDDGDQRFRHEENDRKETIEPVEISDDDDDEDLFGETKNSTVITTEANRPEVSDNGEVHVDKASSDKVQPESDSDEDLFKATTVPASVKSDEVKDTDDDVVKEFEGGAGDVMDQSGTDASQSETVYTHIDF